MHSRIPALLLVASVGAGLGALAVTHLMHDARTPENLSQGAVRNLVTQLKGDAPGESDPAQVARVVESLIQLLDEEITERRVLEERLAEVRSELTELQQNLRVRVEAAFAAAAADDVQARHESRIEQTLQGRLAAAGFTPGQFEIMRRIEAEAQMRQIELDDRARREGWADTPRYFREINDLSGGMDAIRRDLGDDAYDRYLFVSGRPNRIAVGRVIETSPAEQAGLQAGDVIASYGGERVFSSEQLNNLRSAGDRGAPVSVEVIRNGARIRITMPRGPMGIQTQPEMFDPGAPDRP